MIEVIRAHPRARHLDPDDRARHARDHEPVRPRRGAQSRPQAGGRPAAGGRQRSGGDRGLSRRSQAVACRRREAVHERRRCCRSRGWRPATTTCRCCGASRSTCAAGGMTTLVGANGAGKTTTLRAITGSIKPFAGRVLFRGEDVTRLPPHAKAARGLVLVPEGRQLFSEMSVEENLEMGAFSSARRRASPSGSSQVYTLFPRLNERRRQKAGTLLRRRAADAGDRARADVRSGNPDHRRAFARPRAGAGADAGRQARGAEAGRPHHPPGRAERASRARAQRLRLRDRRRPSVRRGPSAEVAAMPQIRQAYLGL